MKTTVLVSLLFVFLAMYTIVLAKTPKFVPLVDTNAGVSTGSNLMECSNSNCFETETCCNTTTGKAACCPELDACCCPDHTHCCPTLYTCVCSSNTSCTHCALSGGECLT